MKRWLEIGIHQVNALLKNDPDHKELLEQMETAQEDYNKVMKKLLPDEQNAVERYITICEDLEYQRTITAWYCGKACNT